MHEWDKDKFVAEAQQDYRLGTEKIAEFDKHIYLAMKRLTSGYRSRDCGHVQVSRRSLVQTHRQILREKCARRNRHCQSTTRIEAPFPDCRVFTFVDGDQEVS